MRKSEIIAKISCLILLMALAMLILSGCMRPDGIGYELSHTDDAIVSIEIVEVDNQGGLGSDHVDDFKAIKVIEEDMWEQFLADFRELEYYSYFMDPFYSISDTAFCITYSDGSFDLIDSSSVYYYDSSEEDGDYTNKFFKGEEFDELLNKYLSV